MKCFPDIKDKCNSKLWSYYLYFLYLCQTVPTLHFDLPLQLLHGWVQKIWCQMCWNVCPLHKWTLVMNLLCFLTTDHCWLHTNGLVGTLQSPLVVTCMLQKRTDVEIIIILLWPHVCTLKTKGCQFDNFVITGSTISCYNDNLRCYQWWQSCQIDNILFSA